MLLIIWRAFAFSAMLWLVNEDIKRKGVKYEMFTFWGEISTLVAFSLLTACSLEKLSSQYEYQAKSYVTLNSSRLYKTTAFIFQWAMLAELMLTLLFWVYLYGMVTDFKNLPCPIHERLYYDIFLDVENYNHSLPLALLIVEFMVNNIQFSWKHLSLTILVNFSYLVV